MFLACWNTLLHKRPCCHTPCDRHIFFLPFLVFSLSQLLKRFGGNASYKNSRQRLQTTGPQNIWHQVEKGLENKRRDKQSVIQAYKTKREFVFYENKYSIYSRNHLFKHLKKGAITLFFLTMWHWIIFPFCKTKLPKIIFNFLFTSSKLIQYNALLPSHSLSILRHREGSPNSACFGMGQ